MTSHVETSPYIVISGRLTVPEDKPIIKRILRVTNTPGLSKGFSKGNMIIFRGNLFINIQYFNTNEKLPKPFLHTYNIPYTHFINSSNYEKNIRINLKVVSEYQEFTIINERVLHAYVLLRIDKSEEYK